MMDDTSVSAVLYSTKRSAIRPAAIGRRCAMSSAARWSGALFVSKSQSLFRAALNSFLFWSETETFQRNSPAVHARALRELHRTLEMLARFVRIHPWRHVLFVGDEEVRKGRAPARRAAECRRISASTKF